MDASPGTYVLLLRNDAVQPVDIGRRGRLDARRGWYLYVGSAFGPGGVRARVGRHCRAAKSLHWHIEYLCAVTTPAGAWYRHRAHRDEHAWAAALLTLDGATPVPGFGCSDCRCATHLAYFRRRPALADFQARVDGGVRAAGCTQIA